MSHDKNVKPVEVKPPAHVVAAPHAAPASTQGAKHERHDKSAKKGDASRPGKPLDGGVTIVTSAPVDAKKEPYVTREAVLKLLSDEEIARVSTDEGSGRLSASDEYLDLEHLDQGVKRGPSTGTPMGRVLARKAIRSESWDKVTALVGHVAKA